MRTDVLAAALGAALRECKAMTDDAKGDYIPEELWMLRLAWNGWFAMADDDLPGTNPYLVFMSREHAEVAANQLRNGELGIECIAVMVKGPG
jgi:hypothetical protein